MNLGVSANRAIAGTICVILASSLAAAETTKPDGTEDSLVLENLHFALSIDRGTGSITSFIVKATGLDMIGEKRLASNFRICLPLEDYLCNYIDGARQTASFVIRDGDAVTATFSGMSSEKGTYPIDLAYTITLEDETVRFRAKLTNHAAQSISEFYFPQLGGWTQFGEDRDGALATPGFYGNWECKHGPSPFLNFPGGRGLGAEAAEWLVDYPQGMMMPWISLHDAKTNHSLYLGYHDTTLRQSVWHMYLYPTITGGPDPWLTPEQTNGEPVGIVFSHVRFPFIHSGETFDTGEFIIRVHEGDWRQGSPFYRKWFLEHFPIDKSNHWLREQSAWFTSILLQPEDRVTADFTTYDQWTKDAQEYGITTFEIIGWDRGGLERQYPEYVPEERLGGREGWLALLQSIRDRGGRSLPFVNYNVLDPNTEWYERELHAYTHQDQFGKTRNWMAWGESTLIARLGWSVRRHVMGSVVPPLEKILEDQFVQIARDGADGLQIDKLCVGYGLDFNPLHTMKPDVANYEGLVQAIGRVYNKCREINPEFCFGAEDLVDRMIPYVDVFYRSNVGVTVAPLRYVFPELATCQHVGFPRDFNGVNGAVLTGSVICVEPGTYQDSLANPLYAELGRYIREVERIRSELKDIIFLGNYYDTLEARVHEVAKPDATNSAAGKGSQPAYPIAGYTPQPSATLHYRVHGDRETNQRAIVVVNLATEPCTYAWEFLHADVETVNVYEPFQAVRVEEKGTAITIPARSVQILVEQISGESPE